MQKMQIFQAAAVKNKDTIFRILIVQKIKGWRNMTNTQKNKIYKLAYEKVKQDKKEEIIRHLTLLSYDVLLYLMIQIADVKSIVINIICYIFITLAGLCSIWSIYNSHKYVKIFANDINNRLFDIHKTNQGDYEVKIDDYTVLTVLKNEFQE